MWPDLLEALRTENAPVKSGGRARRSREHEGADFLRVADFCQRAVGRDENPRLSTIGGADRGLRRQRFPEKPSDGGVLSHDDPLTVAALDAGDGSEFAGRFGGGDESGDEILVAPRDRQAQRQEFATRLTCLLICILNGLDLFQLRCQSIR